MPLYDYRCAACGQTTEVRHGFDETYAEPCPNCGGSLTRLFNPAGIVFKGSGFYVTDSRKATQSKSESGKSESSKPESSKSEGLSSSSSGKESAA